MATSKVDSLGGSTANSYNETLHVIQDYHDEAHLYVTQGLTCDEKGETEQAVIMYTKGLGCINKALHLHYTLPGHIKKQHKVKQVENMMRNKEQVTSRIELLSNSNTLHMRDLNVPPTYEEATSTCGTDMLISDVTTNPQYAGFCATKLFEIEDGVQMYYITPEGYVSAPSYPTSLIISQISNMPHVSSNLNASAFLQIGDWIYPFVAGYSPAFRTEWASYIFPDTTSNEAGCAVGVIIPDSVTPERKMELESLLSEYTVLRRQDSTGPSQPDRLSQADQRRSSETQEYTSTKIASGIVGTAEWIAGGLSKGAIKTSELVKRGSTKLKENIQVESNPTHIGSKTQQGVYYAKQASGVAVTVSGFVVSQLGKATMALGRQAAPHIRKQGEKYLPQVFASNGEGRSNIDGVAEVAAGGIAGFSTVYVGLENAAKVLSKSIADGTTDVVQHKYGADAGELTHNVLYTTGYLALTTQNVGNLGTKAIAKRMAKDTGKAVLENAAEKDVPKSEKVDERK